MLLPSLGPQQRSPGCQKDRMLSPLPGPGSAGGSSPATRPIQAASGGDSALGEEHLSPQPALWGRWPLSWLGSHLPPPSQSGRRASLSLDLPRRWGWSHPWPVSQSSPIHPGSQVPMVTLLRGRDDHCPRPTLGPGPGMRSTHNLSEIGFPGL